ncbi:hypothetical protein [Propionivibrio sp.]|uniref:hypothetical protein n=1 Tax=Propionivibrio sp. TaxID=2212460 RepID=UPI00260E7192|nr:hypothetical protein [Propionivibrio sp.]
MIPSSQASAPAEVVDSALMLPGDQIDASFHQQGGGEVVAVITVGQDDVPRIQFRQPPGDCILARTVLTERLTNEQRQGHQRGIDSFPKGANFLDHQPLQIRSGHHGPQALGRLVAKLSAESFNPLLQAFFC